MVALLFVSVSADHFQPEHFFEWHNDRINRTENGSGSKWTDLITSNPLSPFCLPKSFMIKIKRFLIEISSHAVAKDALESLLKVFRNSSCSGTITATLYDSNELPQMNICDIKGCFIGSL